MTNRFHPGMRICCRGEEWQVVSADHHRLANGGQVWEIEARGLTGIVAGQQFVFLNDIDQIDVIDPKDIDPVIDTSKGAEKAKLYWEAHLRRLLPRNGALYISQHGAVDPLEYQFAPAAKALHLLRPRILIGDAVGLGKTIECGILLSELIRRGKGKRVLCAVPKAILEQFQMEMWARFAIPFHRLDSQGLERLRQDLPSTMNPFYHYDKAIISIDTLKLKKYQQLLEHCQWDVLIIDECHNVADRTDGAGGSSRHRVARRLADKAHSVILMSATPHDGTRHGFASLIKLLDKTKIKDDEKYTNQDFSDHFIRRNRTQVAAQISQRGSRQQKIEQIPLTPAEMNLLQLLHDGEKLTDLMLTPTRSGTKELFKTTLIKSFLSSPAALHETVSKKLKRLSETQKGPETKNRASFENFLRNVKADIEALKGFSRLTHLKSFLTSHPIASDNRLVIFTERLATMRSIKDFLLKEKIVDAEYDPRSEEQAAGKLIATADGSMADHILMHLVKAFQASRGGPQILIATNVASEGLNLHKNCHRLIHFDLPWSLITLEQRNGRIDRLGQEKIPYIYYLASTAQGKTRETDAEKLKDDFWITEKIERRMRTASEDMDEQAQVRFCDGTLEEEEYTQRYQDKRSLEEDDGCSLDFLNTVTLSSSAESLVRKKLPTLYQKSPADFIRGVCKEAGLNVTERSTELSIELSKVMRFEVDQWTREFRPAREENRIVFEDRPDKMQEHYLKALNQDSPLTKSFMNEIHPAIALLETTALGFFAGRGVPTVALKLGDPETVYFLIQATLFNRRNDIVNQYWQVIEHKKGSPKQVPLFDIQDNSHAVQITNWLNERLKHMRSIKHLSESAVSRIRRQTEKAVQLVSEQTAEIRIKRTTTIGPILKKELQRIKSWEAERRQYLTHIAEGEKSHAGHYAEIARAKNELDRIGTDSENYRSFINDYLATNEQADIRILGCLIVEEGK